MFLLHCKQPIKHVGERQLFGRISSLNAATLGYLFLTYSFNIFTLIQNRSASLPHQHNPVYSYIYTI